MFYCSLYRRAAWQTVGGYNESMRAGEDWDFWIGCVEHGFDAHHIHEALFGARNKDTGLHLEAAENDLAIRARIVANHPGLFKPITRGWAQAVLGQDAEAGLRDERVPDDILTRAAEMDQFLTAVMALQRTTRVQYYHIKRLEKALAAHNGTAGPIPQERVPPRRLPPFDSNRIEPCSMSRTMSSSTPPGTSAPEDVNSKPGNG